MRKAIFLFLMLQVFLGCKLETSIGVNGSINPSQNAAIDQSDEAFEGDLFTTNEDGEVIDLEGYSPSPILRDHSKSSDQEIREMYQNDQEVFEFNPPENYEADFSPPNMITGSSLLLTTSSEEECSRKSYQANEPGYKELVDYADDQNICGFVTINFCIRMKSQGPSNVEKDSKKYIYAKTPNIALEIACQENTFDDLSVEVRGIESGNRAIEIEADPSVLEVYLTSSPDCADGGVWEPITGKMMYWNLDDKGDIATVFAKFKDRFNGESTCISSTNETSTNETSSNETDTSQTNTMEPASSQDSCLVEDPGYTAENIVGGVTIGELEGSARLDYPECTADGEIGCIANAEFVSEKSAGLGSKILFGNTVGGVTGTIVVNNPVDCSGGGQENCITTDTYKSMDLTTKGAGGALAFSSQTFSTKVKTSSIIEFWDETGTRHTAAGDSDIIEVNILNGIEIFGTIGTAGAAPDCSSIAVGGSWIRVPGDPYYGTNDFCVMKYEAKCSLIDGTNCTAAMDTESPISTAAGTPWVFINQQDSETECASLGKGYRLITNDEWMTIASNIAAQAENWDGGIVGTNELARGHTDNNPNSICPANIDDNKSYVQTDCLGIDSHTFNQRRTHTLSNGEVIWDLSGNAWEWTNYFNNKEKPSPNTDDWYEFTELTGTSAMTITDLVPQVAISNSWNSAQSLGRYRPGTNGTDGALRRGGDWDIAEKAGIFSARLSQPPTDTKSGLGFRCTVELP